MCHLQIITDPRSVSRSIVVRWLEINFPMDVGFDDGWRGDVQPDSCCKVEGFRLRRQSGSRGIGTLPPPPPSPALRICNLLSRRLGLLVSYIAKAIFSWLFEYIM